MKPRSFSFSFSLVLVLSLSLIKKIVLARSWLKVRQMLGIQHELVLACTAGLHSFFAKEDRLKQLQLQKRQRDKHKEAFEDNTRETLVEKRRKHGKKCNTDVKKQFWMKTFFALSLERTLVNWKYTSEELCYFHKRNVFCDGSFDQDETVLHIFFPFIIQNVTATNGCSTVLEHSEV